MDWTRHSMERKDIIFNGKILANARIFLSHRPPTASRKHQRRWRSGYEVGMNKSGVGGTCEYEYLGRKINIFDSLFVDTLFQ